MKLISDKIAEENLQLREALKRHIVELEHKNRQLEIEASLERVRSKAMAMRSSDELNAIIGKIFTECIKLDIQLDRGIIMIFDPESLDSWWWMANPEAPDLPRNYHVPYNAYAPYLAYLNEWKERTVRWTYILEGKEKKDWDAHLFANSELSLLPTEVKQVMTSFTKVYLNASFNNFGGLTLASLDPMWEEHFDILLKFAKVFDLTYTRFNDLKQAEAQARKAHIETALERVRSRTMAMQKSDELAEVAALLFKLVSELNIKTWTTGFNVWSEDGNSYTDYVTSPQGNIIKAYTIDTTEFHVFREVRDARNRGEKFWIQYLEGELLKETYRELTRFGNEKQYEKMLEDGFEFPSSQYVHFVFGSQVSLMFITYQPIPEAHDIFIRFGRVFEQTYTRFLDLQKAEAQAREAHVEAALERVRSRTMAMQHSNELAQAAQLLYQQFHSLGISTLTCAYMFIEEDKNLQRGWPVIPDGTLHPDFIDFPLTGDTVLDDRYQSWKEKRPMHEAEIHGEDNKEHHRFLTSKVSHQFAENIVAHLPDQVYFYNANFSHGYLLILNTTPLSTEEKSIAIRFAKVFEQTYTRFLDLQKAEAQAKEVNKQASLDRVRGEIASMRTSEDLNRITPLIWRELKTLEVPFIRCGVFIIGEEDEKVKVYLTTPEGKALGAMNLSFDTNELTRNIVDNWRKKHVFKAHWNKDDFIEWTKSMMKLGQIQNAETYQGSETPPESLNLHVVPFRQGMLYVGDVSPLTEEKLELVKSLAESFSIAYARYEDFKKLEIAKQSLETTLLELKAAQSQLIQAEKMASLGELTAGIAHEIQNPLNFVNNFSEVNNELIDEMNEELNKGAIMEAKEIASDIKQNLDKILLHGKRADSIVKGMLQHSRSSSGVKEPTDINKLADEYLRLTYHGLRAKDKSFNATMKTDYDQSIGTINIIPQDIGRVLLNLITNAFYAVSEKKKQVPPPSEGGIENPQKQYEPTVTVTTKLIIPPPGEMRGALISVKDNGNGIPPKVLDKIFQPFFTTKPTGQGTGLGLSMSYDIVKAHGGELKVKTREGEGAEFTIELISNYTNNITT